MLSLSLSLVFEEGERKQIKLETVKQFVALVRFGLLSSFRENANLEIRPVLSFLENKKKGTLFSALQTTLGSLKILKDRVLQE